MILITGAAGYIGSHTAVNFINNGYDVLIFDSLETGHLEIVNILEKIGNVKFVKGDLKNVEDLNKVFDNYQIDAVIHFAAFSLVGESVSNPAKYYRNNVYGTLNLLDSMVKHNVKKLVFSSTCATYGEPKYTPIDEKHPQSPINPYGNSKLCVEYMLKDYDKAYDLKSIILRYFNVAGCDEQARIGEWHEPETHLIPNIVKSVFKSENTFKIFGDDYDTQDGTCVRDYVNVEDLAEAHRLAYLYLEKNNKSDIFNIGTEQGSTVKQVFNTCEKVLERKIPYEIVARREGDPAKLYANADKAKNELNWNSSRNLEQSIKSAFAWEHKLSKIKEGK